MKSKIIALFIFISVCSFGQINFVEGYFIDNSDLKTAGWIGIEDQQNNPKGFRFKSTQNGEEISKSISEVKEFGLNGTTKFVRATVKIDTSSQNIQVLSTNPEPEFVTKTLFLEVLVEGSNKLYFYTDSQISDKFFFSNKTSEIEQLVAQPSLSTEIRAL